MAIRTKKYKSHLAEVRAIKITEKNLEDIVEYIRNEDGSFARVKAGTFTTEYTAV